MQRDKGASGEREIAGIVRELTGWDVRRRVRQHGNDSDLTGAPGWAIEVKRHRTAQAGEIARWWAQTVAQAGNLLPLLLYRADRCEWRARWPLAVLLTHQSADYWQGVEWTCDSSIQAWAAVARECATPGATPMTKR